MTCNAGADDAEQITAAGTWSGRQWAPVGVLTQHLLFWLLVLVRGEFLVGKRTREYRCGQGASTCQELQGLLNRFSWHSRSKIWPLRRL
ncbi:Hypothetical protein FKW44_005975 [Caligus rogercresseyi]|uniref:Uncharacterized protein n=1 Tax=Caligus rogercresseyi TaxID=217165 RepID=A0A7T8KCR3_CALRO|nr:Hypothetical protein FKW44_005975 [Caligus rogercresseyi]